LTKSILAIVDLKYLKKNKIAFHYVVVDSGKKNSFVETWSIGSMSCVLLLTKNLCIFMKGKGLSRHVKMLGEKNDM